MARAYVPADREQLALLLTGELPIYQIVWPESEDEQDEYDALMTAAEYGEVVIAVDVNADAELAERTQVAAIHLDVDGSGDLAWFAPDELSDVIALL